MRTTGMMRRKKQYYERIEGILWSAMVCMGDYCPSRAMSFLLKLGLVYRKKRAARAAAPTVRPEERTKD